MESHLTHLHCIQTNKSPLSTPHRLSFPHLHLLLHLSRRTLTITFIPSIPRDPASADLPSHTNPRSARTNRLATNPTSYFPSSSQPRSAARTSPDDPSNHHHHYRQHKRKVCCYPIRPLAEETSPAIPTPPSVLTETPRVPPMSAFSNSNSNYLLRAFCRLHSTVFFACIGRN